MSVPRLLLSKLPRFHGTQRFISRVVWGSWLTDFLVRELTGTLRWTPWRTLSETAWDVEEQHPGTVRLLQGFLLGLTIHIRYRTTLKSSVTFGLDLQADFDAWVKRKEGYGNLARAGAGAPRPLDKP